MTLLEKFTILNFRDICATKRVFNKTINVKKNLWKRQLNIILLCINCFDILQIHQMDDEVVFLKQFSRGLWVLRRLVDASMMPDSFCYVTFLRYHRDDMVVFAPNEEV